MGLVIKVFVGMLVAAAVGGSVFAQDAKFADLASKVRTEIRTVSGRGSVASSIKPENLAAYYVGKGFDEAKRFIIADKTADAIVSIVYLWNDLGATPEAEQVDIALHTLLRDKHAAVMKLEAARVTTENRISSEQKWYYSAGKNYAQMAAHLGAKNYAAFLLTLAEYGKLGKAAPAGTPAQLIAAFVKLGEYSSKTPLTESDVATVGQQLDIIDILTEG